MEDRTMIKKFFDPNKTVRRISYREEKRRQERLMRLSDLFFKIMAIVSLIGFAILGALSLMAR